MTKFVSVKYINPSKICGSPLNFGNRKNFIHCQSCGSQFINKYPPLEYNSFPLHSTVPKFEIFKNHHIFFHCNHRLHFFSTTPEVLKKTNNNNATNNSANITINTINTIINTIGTKDTTKNSTEMVRGTRNVQMERVAIIGSGNWYVRKNFFFVYDANCS